MFTQKDLNLRKRRWLELSNNYGMRVFYHPKKANEVADALNNRTIGSVSHVYEAKKDLVNDVYRLARLGVTLEDGFRNQIFEEAHGSH